MPELIVSATRDSLRLLRRSGWPRPQTVPLAERALPADAWQAPAVLRQTLGALLDGAPRSAANGAASFMLPDATARYFMCTAPRNAASIADCAAAAAARFHEIYAESPEAWQIAGDWDAHHPFLACALPRPLLAALEQLAQERRLKVASIAPHFVSAWNRWHARLDAAWFATLHDACLTVAASDGRRLQGVRSTALPSGALADPHWLAQHLAREALRLDLPTPRRLKLCGELPAQAAWRQGTAELQLDLLSGGLR